MAHHRVRGALTTYIFSCLFPPKPICLRQHRPNAKEEGTAWESPRQDASDRLIADELALLEKLSDGVCMTPSGGGGGGWKVGPASVLVTGYTMKCVGLQNECHGARRRTLTFRSRRDIDAPLFLPNQDRKRVWYTAVKRTKASTSAVFRQVRYNSCRIFFISMFPRCSSPVGSFDNVSLSPQRKRCVSIENTTIPLASATNQPNRASTTAPLAISSP